uniref:Uncharacterized protein n=1 Tax=Oncorhynchus mykiss TaxID=8022 RepID=A0A8C7TKF6_ONCMY
MYSSRRFVGRDGWRHCTPCYHTTLLSDSVVVCTKHLWMVMVEDQPPTAQMHIFGQCDGLWRHIEAVGSELRGLLKSAVETAPGAMGPEQAKLLVLVSSQGLQTPVAFCVMGACFQLPDEKRVLKTITR